MNIGRYAGGLFLLAVALWVFLTMDEPTAWYLGGALLAIIAIALLATKGKSRPSD